MFCRKICEHIALFDGRFKVFKISWAEYVVNEVLLNCDNVGLECVTRSETEVGPNVNHGYVDLIESE